MKLTEISTADILAELKKRNEIKNNDNVALVLGTIGINNGSNFVELFKEIKTDKDLNCLTQLSLRSRYNPHRNYECFYFKTTEFDKLKINLNDDNESFADWIRDTESIKYVQL